MLTEQQAWASLGQQTPRRRYEHVKAWTKRNRRRASFVRRLDRTPDGCWVWTGASSVRPERTYPVVSHRELDGRRVQQSAFAWLINEFFPDLTPMTRHRSIPACGTDLCVNPWHRSDRRVTRWAITSAQARAIYSAKGVRDIEVVAAEHGISCSHVSAIWRGRCWGWVTNAPVYSPGRRAYTDSDVDAVLALKGTGSSRQVADQLGVNYKFVLSVWSGSRTKRNSEVQT